MDIPASRLVEYLRSRASTSDKALLIFWVRIGSSRDAFKSEILSLRQDLPVVPLVVRDSSFASANAVMTDLESLIQDRRRDFDSLMDGSAAALDKLLLLLISRSELGLAQAESPALMPEWVPVVGGRTVYAVIEDVTAAVDAPLNAPELRLHELCEGLYELEQCLLDRLEAVRIKDHGAGNAFYDRLTGSGRHDISYAEFLERAYAAHRAVRNPSAFRPSAKLGDSIIGRLVRIGGEASPNELLAWAKALARALRLEAAPTAAVRDSVLALLLRSTTPVVEADRRVARNLIVSVYGAAQLVTAAAHGGEYDRYPLVLLRSVSYDLRRTLQALVLALQGE